MRITADMKIKEVLHINQHMLRAFVWLAPEFGRLLDAPLRDATARRMSVGQAARLARLPLTEALYILNLTAGEPEEALVLELQQMAPENFEFTDYNSAERPTELLELRDDDPRVHFVDLTTDAERGEDHQTVIVRELRDLCTADELLLVRYRFDLVALRDLLTVHGFESWGEQRRPYDWYIYFYRANARAGASIGAAASARPARAMVMAAAG